MPADFSSPCVWDYIKQARKPVVLYGTGAGADKVLDRLMKLGVAVSGIFAGDDFVRDRFFRGFRVENFEACFNRLGDMLVLMCFGSSRPEVLENVERIGKKCELLFPEAPVYGETFSDGDFFRENSDRIDYVREMLADEKSVRTFDDIINFKFTGRIEHLFDAAALSGDAASLIKLSDGAKIADFGAYTGDTALEFAALYPRFSSITAVEPGKRNFRKLCENTAGYENIRCLNAFVSDSIGTVTVEKNKGRGVNPGAGETVETVTADSLFYDTGVDFIKADVEGTEDKMLSGAEKTIKKYRPALKIACYHRSEDIFAIPEKLNSLIPGCRLYMRHTGGLPAWNTDYILPQIE